MFELLAELRAARAPHAGLPLLFEYGGRTVQPGYHVTEVETPLTSEYLAVSCPDQGTLSGQEVETLRQPLEQLRR